MNYYEFIEGPEIFYLDSSSVRVKTVHFNTSTKSKTVISQNKSWIITQEDSYDFLHA
jgi:hypothetical protein